MSVTVGQPAVFGALPGAVARDMGCPAVHPPGPTTRRIAGRYLGGAETDARGAFVITDAARTVPHALRSAGLAPAPRPSGSSIRGEHPSRRGNKRLERAFLLSASAPPADPVSQAHHDKRTAQGKHHAQGLLHLARRRSGALFAMFRDGTFGDLQPAPTG